MGRVRGKAWMQEHVADAYVKRAHAEGLRSRASYKLEQIAERDRLLAPGMLVVDLGAAPGGWSQVAARRVAPAGSVIALDVLDMPTINHFEASFASHFDERMQKTNHADGDSFERYASGVLPDGAPATLNRSPVINYPYAKMRPILERLKNTGDVDKRHGARVRYANPINGGPVLPTMGAYLALFPKGFKGESYRSTDGTIFAVAEGQGTTMIDGKPIETHIAGRTAVLIEKASV